MMQLFIASSVVFVCFSFALHIVFHELGHYLLGLLTGWKLIYLQIWKIVFYHDRVKSKYKIKFVPCKGYQCIMKPNTIGCFSFGYTLGGIFINMVLTITGEVAIIKMYYHPFASLFLLSFILSGVALLICNGIPRIKNLCNDMSCFLLTKENKSTSICHNTQFVIADELSKGITYSMMQEDLFTQVKNIEINDITAYTIILNYYFHLNRDEFNAAYQELAKINEFSKISKHVLCIYHLEIFYLYMIMSLYGCKPFVSASLPRKNDEVIYIQENTIRGDLHALRVNIMYQAYTRVNNNDNKGAIEELEKGITEIINASCIYQGEKNFCEDQLTAVCNMLKRMAFNEIAQSS